MTDDSSLPAPVERALEDHDAFDPRGRDTYALRTTVFETSLTATAAEGSREWAIHLTVRVPTLDAAVASESVAAVVEDGWFETFERRLADVFGVANAETHDAPTLERDDTEGEIRVHLEYVSQDAATGVEDAKALAEYVEGTYAQGIVPGYEYRGPAAQLLEAARTRGQRAAEGDGSPP